MTSDKAIPSYNKQRNNYGFFSATPLPSTTELAEFYAKTYYQNSASTTYQVTYSEDELAQKRLRSELLLHAALLQRKGIKGQFLEVGCGEGFLLNAASEAGFDVEGLDFSIHGIETFHPRLIGRVHVGDAFDLLDQFIDQGKPVDVCVLQNVLEHVIDPALLLNRIKRLVGPDGLVIITVPNDFSALQEQVMEQKISDREYWFAPPQHLHYFNVDTLIQFVTDMGFGLLDSYGDFPIEMFLFHPDSNYVADKSKGKGAHQARVALDLLLARKGVGPYHRFCQAITGCGLGRNVTVVLQPGAE